MSVSTSSPYWPGFSKHTLFPDASTWTQVGVAIALALLIFVIDTFTMLDIAVAVMYVVVVLLSANFCGRRGILLWGLACAALTLTSFLCTHAFSATEGVLGRTFISILAIATTTLLAMRIRSATDALRRSEGYLADAQRLSRTGSFFFNAATDEYIWSDETYRIFEYDRSIKPTIELARARLHPDDLKAWNASIEERRTRRENVDMQYRLSFPGGRVKHIHSLAHPDSSPGGDLEYVGALMDITAAKQAEDELHEAHTALTHVTRVTALGELMASIAHEVNQPLAGIVTNGEACKRWLARDVPDLDEAQSAVQRMINDGRRASEIIRRLWALSRKDGLQIAPLNLNDIITEAIPLVRRELINSNVDLRMELSPALPLTMGDRIQLQQVIINLAVNAVQSMSKVKVRARTLCIRSERYNETGICVSVRDNGTGIDPDNLDRLFKAFFTTRDGGMGMGLSICRSIIEAHGGQMWARNNDDFGASFGFTLKPEMEAA